MPVPEGVDEDKYRRCIRDVKAEAPAGRDPDEYAHRICNAQLAKEAYNEAVSDLTRILSRIFSLQKYMESDEDPEDEADIDKPDTASAGAVNPTHTADEEEEEVEKSDKDPFGTLLTVDIEKQAGRNIGGWATVQVVDRQGEVVDINAFDEKVLKNFMERTGGRIHLQHQDIPIGKITKFTKRKKPNGLPGLWIEASLFNLDSIDEAVHAAIRNGDITGFSIKGKAIGKGTKCTPELCYAYVPNIELYGISAVERPANPESLIESKAERRGRTSRPRPTPQILSPLEVLAKEWGVD